MTSDKRKAQLRESQKTYRANSKARLLKLVAAIEELLAEIKQYMK